MKVIFHGVHVFCGREIGFSRNAHELPHISQSPCSLSRLWNQFVSYFQTKALKSGTWQLRFSWLALVPSGRATGQKHGWEFAGRELHRSPWTHKECLLNKKCTFMCAELVTLLSFSVITAQLPEFGVSFYSPIALKCFKTILIWKWLILCVLKDIFLYNFVY